MQEKLPIKVLVAIMGCCGVIPLHSFSTIELCKKQILRLQVLVLIAMATAINTYHVCKIHEHPSYHSFSELLEIAIAQLTWVIAIAQSYHDRVLWHKLIRTVTRASNYQWNLMTLIKCPLFYIMIFDGAIHVLGVMTSDVLHSISEVHHHVTFLGRNLICLRIVVVMYFFKQNYKQLKERLQVIAESKGESAMATITSIKKRCLELDGLTQDFNCLNGHQILLVIASSSLQLMNMTIYLMRYFKVMFSTSNDMPSKWPFPLTYLGTTVNLFYMMECCNSVGQASEELLKTIYEVERNFSIFSGEFLELKSLSKLIYFHRTTISAADYFEINRLTIFYFLYNTSIYFVVLVQFYNG